MIALLLDANDNEVRRWPLDEIRQVFFVQEKQELSCSVKQPPAMHTRRARVFYLEGQAPGGHFIYRER